MKNLIIGGLVGGLILFVWQFVSWSFTPIHKAEMGYTEHEAEILAAMEGKLADGTYILPGMAPGTTQEQHEAKMMENMGKPWATISYHNSMQASMGMNMARAFIVDFLSVILLCWLFMKFETLDMRTSILGSIAVGAIGYMTVSYLNSIWFQTNTMGQLLDTLIEWTLVGAWLGYWLNRK
jgi:hypothetical protein